MKRSELSALLKELGETFDTEISKLAKESGNRAGFSKKTRGDMSAGFRDGARSAIQALQQKGELKVEED